MIGHNRAQLVVLRDGQRARALELAPWLIPALPFLLASLVAFCGYLGWTMQGRLATSGLTAQWEGGTAQEEWLVFHLLGRLQRSPYSQLHRQSTVQRARNLGLGQRSTAAALLSGQVAPEWLTTLDLSGPPAETLHWPVPAGWYVRGYGSGEGHYHLAVDIMGEAGTDVIAAASGIVGYAGNGVKGFGNMVMLLHDGGLVTAYAHNRHNLVAVGERVKRGQAIAVLGSTGLSRGPHVHFELIYKGRNCDPLPLFRPGIRHRSGHFSDLPTKRWDDAPRPPVRCAPRRHHPRSRKLDDPQEGDLPGLLAASD